MAKLPLFAATDTFDKVQSAIDAGVLTYPAYVFSRDERSLSFVDKEGLISKVVGDNPVSVLKVDALPDPADAKDDILYIFNGIVYVFDGEKFKPQYEECADWTEQINKALEDAKSYTDSTIETAKEEIDALYESIEYEVTSKPNGTLVNYNDKEIRVMCPVTTEWKLQQSGENADPNTYYIGFKAYAPEDAVSFKEDLTEIITDNTMYYFEGNDFAGTDKFGRKYSIVWLPVAVFANDSWTYYGANSTKEKYIGWYYSVEWYNSEGIIIATDCIRINLSNENCHNSIKPYYIKEVMDSVDLKIEEKITELESGFTFVEI